MTDLPRRDRSLSAHKKSKAHMKNSSLYQRKGINLLLIGLAFLSTRCGIDIESFTFDDELFAAISDSDGLGGQANRPGEQGEVAPDKQNVPDDDSEETSTPDDKKDNDDEIVISTQSAACEAGSLRCGSSENAGESLSQTYVCSGVGSDASWSVSGGACPYVCDQGNCTGICEPGESRCLSDIVLEVCSDLGEWQEQDCKSQACVATSCQGECRPSSTRCSGKNIERCNDVGVWKLYQNCDNQCDDGLCTGECSEGSTQCQASAGEVPVLLTCTSAADWSEASETNCEYVCGATPSSSEAEFACAGECVPSRRECVNNDSSVGSRRCSTEGQWLSVTPCSEGCQAGLCNICQPGARQCTGNTAQMCLANGTWGSGITCEEQICAGGYCGDCAPGQQRCNNNDIEGCVETATGYRWQVEQVCSKETPGPADEPGSCGNFEQQFECVYRACEFAKSRTYFDGDEIQELDCTEQDSRCDAVQGICVGTNKICPGTSEGCIDPETGWRCSALTEGSAGTYQQANCNCESGGQPTECEPW